MVGSEHWQQQKPNNTTASNTVHTLAPTLAPTPAPTFGCRRAGAQKMCKLYQQTSVVVRLILGKVSIR